MLDCIGQIVLRFLKSPLQLQNVINFSETDVIRSHAVQSISSIANQFQSGALLRLLMTNEQ